jgi:hypothetical protein
MTCHNGSQQNNYSGPGLENPHPFPGAEFLTCSQCHGGNPNGSDKDSSHVPPPPEIGDDQNLIDDDHAYFNRLTLTGIDKFGDYNVGGTNYTALDFLQFINPGDLRVVTQGRSCGACHDNHAEMVGNSLLATEAGILSGAMFAAGVENQNVADRGVYEDTASDLGFRAAVDPFYALSAAIGPVSSLNEYPVYSVRNQPGSIHNNPAYDNVNIAADLANNVDPVTNQLVEGSPLADLYHEQVAFTCGDCHLGSAGANNRYGDFRSSGCTSCHMPYSLDGRSGSQDPNINKFEPVDPDQIEAPERAHVRGHRIASVHKTLPNGIQIQGIDDYACAGCHQGSNRTVMQYWGIRLDQNEDLRRGVQYPAQPTGGYTDTRNDTRLFDPVVNNNTFNGRRDRQYILFEDYDNDNRDDTPADVHYEAGMGCIDCHGSYDLHGGDAVAGDTTILSRMEQAVAISCQSCHGGIEAYAATVTGTAHDGTTQEIAVDTKGNELPHVVKEADGYYLYSRLTGSRHYLPQTKDTVDDNGAVNPLDANAPVYSPHASYAMGRVDADPSNGVGPLQDQAVTAGFAHSDDMDCASCHASWTNTCMGCHLEGEYRGGNEYSNITGEEIVFEEDNADFVYQSPVFFQLGVDPSNKITQFSANTKTFFRWEDRFNQVSERMAFSDRNGQGNAPGTPFSSLSHNAMMAHSIRGKVTPTNEGPRYCVACHLTTDSTTPAWRVKYDAFRTAMRIGDVAALDFTELTNEIGLNPGNQNNSPYFVHMVAGLGSGLFYFDEHGAPVNPIDNDANRAGADDGSPASQFATAVPFFNLDRIVEDVIPNEGVSTASNNHAMLDPGAGPNLRDGAANPNMSGPLGRTLVELLADPDLGLVLDSWLDANGLPGGNATNHIP